MAVSDGAWMQAPKPTSKASAVAQSANFLPVKATVDVACMRYEPRIPAALAIIEIDFNASM
jgi:phage baseplate assembly protein W